MDDETTLQFAIDNGYVNSNKIGDYDAPTHSYYAKEHELTIIVEDNVYYALFKDDSREIIAEKLTDIFNSILNKITPIHTDIKSFTVYAINANWRLFNAGNNKEIIDCINVTQDENHITRYRQCKHNDDIFEISNKLAIWLSFSNTERHSTTQIALDICDIVTMSREEVLKFASECGYITTEVDTLPTYCNAMYDLNKIFIPLRKATVNIINDVYNITYPNGYTEQITQSIIIDLLNALIIKNNHVITDVKSFDIISNCTRNRINMDDDIPYLTLHGTGISNNRLSHYRVIYNKSHTEYCIGRFAIMQCFNRNANTHIAICNINVN